MSEAVTLMGGAKTPLAEYVADQGALPAAITDVARTVSGKYVAGITLGGNATNIYLTAAMNTTGVNSAIQGRTVGGGLGGGGGARGAPPARGRARPERRRGGAGGGGAPPESTRTWTCSPGNVEAKFLGEQV